MNEDDSRSTEDLKAPVPKSRTGTLVPIFLIAFVLLAVLGGIGLNFRNQFIDNCALCDGSNIHKALVNYASGNEGNYPSGENANEALGHLVDDLTSEKPFFVEGSPWHGEKFSKGPDNQWEHSSPKGIALEAGENAWSISLDATPRSPKRTPLLANIMEHRRWFLGSKRVCSVVYADGRGDTFEFKKNTIRPSELFPEVNMVDPLPPSEGLPE